MAITVGNQIFFVWDRRNIMFEGFMENTVTVSKKDRYIVVLINFIKNWALASRAVLNVLKDYARTSKLPLREATGR